MAITPSGAQRTCLAATVELEPGEIRKIDLVGRPPVAVVNLEGEYFVIDDTCTHGAASLSEGEIDNGEVICPFHAGSFNVRTGEAACFPCTEPLRVYPVEIVNGKIYAELGS